jgi:hypothetical protein
VPYPGSGVTVIGTTVDSSTQITNTVNIGAGAAIGPRTIRVNNPTGFGFGTCATCFSVTARPGTFTLSPNIRGQGAANQNIVITGSDFQAGAAVAFSGTGITVNSVTVVNPNQINLNIDVDPNATTGGRVVTITNPDGGFRVRNNGLTVAAAPNPTTVTPGSRPQGFTGTVSITGSGFVNGATVAISGTGITVNSVTFNNATRITANITVAIDAAIGPRDITVTNPNAGTRTCLGCLTVTANPTATSLTPPTRAIGTAGTHTINGTGFVSGATVLVSGTGVTASNIIFNSPTQLTVTLTVAPGALVGPRNITVNNPDTGTGTCAGCLTVS